MNDNIRHAIREGTLKIGDVELNCAVLDDETRVLTQKTFLQAIGHSRPAGGQVQKAAIENLPFFLASPALIPFISEDLRRSNFVILFRPRKGGGRQTVEGGKGGRGYAVGVDAKTITAICQAYVDARDKGQLSKVQHRIADKCAVLLRGLQGIGLIALIDEATGYQEQRSKDALRKILEAYINPELLPWTQRFPLEYFKQLFRLRNWTFDPSLKGPRYVGTLNNKLIYEQLPPGVLPELQKRNPSNEKGQRRWKHHQLLTENIGNPHLEKQLIAVTTLMRAAPNWTVFDRMFKRAFPGRQGELALIERQPEERFEKERVNE